MHPPPWLQIVIGYVRMYVSYVDRVANDPFFDFNGSVIINVRNGPWTLVRVFSIFRLSLIF